jgi:hypothetical protein
MGQASPSTAADTLNATAPPQAAPGPAQIQATPNAAGDPKLWEYVDEVAQRLKTAFPLLVLTMETVMDQFSKRFRQTPEEDQYRVFSQMTTEVLTVSTHIPEYVDKFSPTLCNSGCRARMVTLTRIGQYHK